MSDDRTSGPPTGGPTDPPPSHLLPRTRDGRIATIAWVVLFLVAMPPITHRVLDRPEVDVLGAPFLFVALFVVYCLLIGVLGWALRRGL